MEITPVAQETIRAQVAAVAPAQEAKPVQAPVQQQPQAPQKDSVALSQSAKDMAAQVSGNKGQEEAKESPGVEKQEGLTQVIK
jgi:hypothetical protein